MILKISIKGFKLLRPIAKKSRCRVRIIGKKGLPFTMHRYKRRKAFVLGAVVFVLLIYVMASFVWSVDITGNKKLEAGYITERLAAYGVRTGTLKYRINTDTVTNGMMMDVKELAWIGITVKGTRVKVEIVEGAAPPDLVPYNDPCNIIAARDGMIESMVVNEGLSKVKVGDTVKKGQLLVSGAIPSKSEEGKSTYVHAMGTIMARTWYEKDFDVSTIVQEKERTGKKKDNISLVLFGKKLNIFHGRVRYEDSDKVEIKRKLSIGENFVLPFELIIDRYYENNVMEKEVGIEDAKKIAEEKAFSELGKELPEGAKTTDTETRYQNGENGRLTGNIVLECIENIGNTQEIGGN